MQDRTLGILSEIEVEFGNTVIEPKRGVGLGYFSNIMCLCTWCMIQDYDVVASFADDTLVNENHYEQCVRKLEFYKMPVNLEKSGRKWHYLVYFVGACLTEVDIHYLLSENAVLGAILNQRYHWERKAIVSQLPPDNQVVAAYCLERIFGREFFKGEAMSNIDDGGYLSCIPRESGCTRGKYACDVSPHIIKSQWRYDFLPSDVVFKTRKDIHTQRRYRWLSKKRMEHSDLEPVILHREDDQSRYPCDIENYYPEWAEKAYLGLNLTSGSTIGDLSRYEVELALTKYSNSPNPISSFLRKEIRYNEYPTSVSDEDKEAFLKATSCQRIPRASAFLGSSNIQIQMQMEVSHDLEVLPLDHYLSDNREEEQALRVSDIPESSVFDIEDEENESTCDSEDLLQAYDTDNISVSSNKSYVSSSSW